MKKLLLLISALLVLLIGALLYNTLTLKSKQLITGTGVPLQLPVDSNAVQHLSQAIQINTISYADTIKMAEAQPHFDSLIQFLQSTYPLVFSSLKDTIINHRNILLKWKGTDAGLA